MKILKTFALISLLFAFACKGGAGSSSPGDVYKDAIMKLADGKYEEVMDMMADEDDEEMTSEEREKTMGIFGMANATIQSKGGIKSIEILNEEISEDGNKASIDYKMTFGNGEVNEDDNELIKVDGKWKLTGL